MGKCIVGNQGLEENLKALDYLDSLPLSINISRLGDGTGIEATLKSHNMGNGSPELPKGGICDRSSLLKTDLNCTALLLVFNASESLPIRLLLATCHIWYVYDFISYFMHLFVAILN